MSTQTPAQQSEKESPSGRFTQLVLKEYQTATGINEFSPAESRRVQNYFLKMDTQLAEAETKRLSTPEDKRTVLEFKWGNINLDQFAQNVAVFAQLGLDPLMPNHINLIPYHNKRTNKFDIGFIRGYKGLEIVARNFAVVPPVDIICELVYSNDEFQMFKKDRQNDVESYLFNVTNPFNRGELIGGFMYEIYHDERLNSIDVMTVADIEKRKPKYASPEFWGGEKTVYKNNKPDGKEKIEGWYKEMCQKTLQRKAWGGITIDGSKITESFAKANKAETVHEANLSATEDVEIIEESPKTIAMSPVAPPVKIEKKPEIEMEKELPKQSEASGDMFPETK